MVSNMVPIPGRTIERCPYHVAACYSDMVSDRANSLNIKQKARRKNELNPKSWTPTFGVFSWLSTTSNSSSR
jgi:hypothetical protein